jgi:HSP20 family molecular chaperone IbpA
MTRAIPVIDPKGAQGEKTGFIRTESFTGPSPSHAPGAEEPGFTLWAGPRALVINAVLPGSDPESLQIDVKGTSLIFRGVRRSGNRANRFSHAVELPYRVDAQRAEVQKENGLISIILKKKESESGNGNGRLEKSILSSARRYFDGNGSAPNNRQEDAMILQSLDRYFEYLREGRAVRERGPA